jgi:hypothetical protein
VTCLPTTHVKREPRLGLSLSHHFATHGHRIGLTGFGDRLWTRDFMSNSGLGLAHSAQLRARPSRVHSARCNHF